MLATLPRPIDPERYDIPIIVSKTAPDTCNNCGMGRMVRPRNEQGPVLVCDAFCGNRWYEPYVNMLSDSGLMKGEKAPRKPTTYGIGFCHYKPCGKEFTKRSPSQRACCVAHNKAAYRDQQIEAANK